MSTTPKTITGTATDAGTAALQAGSGAQWWVPWRWPLLLWELLWVPKPSPVGMTVD